MQVTRIYKNTDGDSLRVDTMVLLKTHNGVLRREMTYYRSLKTELILEPTDRTITLISLVTDATSYESSTGNYLWAKWSDFPTAQCDMSDLPRVGDTA